MALYTERGTGDEQDAYLDSDVLLVNKSWGFKDEPEWIYTQAYRHLCILVLTAIPKEAKSFHLA